MSGSLKVGGSELINDSGGSGALNWSTGVPAGTVLQVVNMASSVQKSTTSAETWTGLNKDITVKSANPKILLIYSHAFFNDTANNAFFIRLKRDTSAISASNFGTELEFSGMNGYFNGSNGFITAVYKFLDSPTISAGSTLYYGSTFNLDYNGSSTPTAIINFGDSNIGPCTSSLTVMEIKS